MKSAEAFVETGDGHSTPTVGASPATEKGRRRRSKKVCSSTAFVGGAPLSLPLLEEAGSANFDGTSASADLLALLDQEFVIQSKEDHGLVLSVDIPTGHYLGSAETAGASSFAIVLAPRDPEGRDLRQLWRRSAEGHMISVLSPNFGRTYGGHEDVLGGTRINAATSSFSTSSAKRARRASRKIRRRRSSAPASSQGSPLFGASSAVASEASNSVRDASRPDTGRAPPRVPNRVSAAMWCLAEGSRRAENIFAGRTLELHRLGVNWSRQHQQRAGSDRNSGARGDDDGNNSGSASSVSSTSTAWMQRWVCRCNGAIVSMESGAAIDCTPSYVDKIARNFKKAPSTPSPARPHATSAVSISSMSSAPESPGSTASSTAPSRSHSPACVGADILPEKPVGLESAASTSQSEAASHVIGHTHHQERSNTSRISRSTSAASTNTKASDSANCLYFAGVQVLLFSEAPTGAEGWRSQRWDLVPTSCAPNGVVSWRVSDTLQKCPGVFDGAGLLAFFRPLQDSAEWRRDGGGVHTHTYNAVAGGTCRGDACAGLPDPNLFFRPQKQSASIASSAPPRAVVHAKSEHGVRETVTQVRHPLARIFAGSSASSSSSAVLDQPDVHDAASGDSSVEVQAAVDVVCQRLQQYSRCLGRAIDFLSARRTDAGFPALFWESHTHYSDRVERHRRMVETLAEDVYRPFPEELSQLSQASSTDSVGAPAPTGSGTAGGGSSKVENGASHATSVPASQRAVPPPPPPPPPLQARAATQFAPLQYLTKFCASDTGHDDPKRAVFGTALNDVSQLDSSSSLNFFAIDGSCGAISNAAINFSLVHSWLGKKTLLTRWGHVSTAADGPAVGPFSNGTGGLSGAGTAFPSSSHRRSKNPDGEGKGDVGSFCAQVMQQSELLCGELQRLQQDVEQSVYTRALDDRRRTAQVLAKRMMHPSIPPNLVQILPFFGGWVSMERKAYMIRRWRPTYLTFRIVVASTVGWEDDPDGDALLASTVLDAIAGGQEEFDSRAGKDLSNAQSDNRAPRLTYKRVLVAWHDSPDKLSEVASGQGNNSPRSPRNHSMLKPLGTISVDYTSTITHTNIKINGSTVPALVLTSGPRSTTGAGATSAPTGPDNVNGDREQLVFAPRSFCSSLTSSEGSVNQFHSTAQAEQEVDKAVKLWYDTLTALVASLCSERAAACRELLEWDRDAAIHGGDPHAPSGRSVSARPMTSPLSAHHRRGKGGICQQDDDGGGVVPGWGSFFEPLHSVATAAAIDFHACAAFLSIGYVPDLAEGAEETSCAWHVVVEPDLHLTKDAFESLTGQDVEVISKSLLSAGVEATNELLQAEAERLQHLLFQYLERQRLVQAQRIKQQVSSRRAADKGKLSVAMAVVAKEDADEKRANAEGFAAGHSAIKQQSPLPELPCGKNLVARVLYVLREAFLGFGVEATIERMQVFYVLVLHGVCELNATASSQSSPHASAIPERAEQNDAPKIQAGFSNGAPIHGEPKAHHASSSSRRRSSGSGGGFFFHSSLAARIVDKKYKIQDSLTLLARTCFSPLQLAQIRTTNATTTPHAGRPQPSVSGGCFFLKQLTCLNEQDVIACIRICCTDDGLTMAARSPRSLPLESVHGRTSDWGPLYSSALVAPLRVPLGEYIEGIRQDIVFFSSPARRLRELWRVVLDSRCSFGYRVREWINWLNGRKAFDVGLQFPGPMRGGDGGSFSGQQSYETSIGFKRSAMAAVFDAGSNYQTPRSITDTLTFVADSILDTAECSPDCSGGFSEGHEQSDPTSRALFAQFMAGLIFPLVFDACVKSMEFVYREMAMQRRSKMHVTTKNPIVRIFTGGSSVSAVGEGAENPIDFLQRRWVLSTEPFRTLRHDRTKSRWLFLALERVSQFPVYLDSPDSDPEELNEFNTLLTEFFSVACNDPRRGRKAALVHAGDNKPVLAIHLRAEVSAPRVLPKFKLPDYIEKDDPDHARGRDLWCRCLDPPIDAEDGFGDTHRLRYLEAFAERNRRQLHQESIDLLHFGAMWRTPSVILRALIWAMDRACTQATVVQRVLKTLKSQMREANGNSVSRFMSSSSRGKKQVQPAPTLPSAARRGAFPQPMEGQKEQGLMEVSIAKLANRRSEKQKVADSVEVQIPQVDHHHKPDNSKAEEVLLSDDAQQCDFCMCFDQVQAELSRQVAQGSSFTSAELYIPIIIWLTKNCANQNLLTMLLFADAFLAFEFPDKLEASRGWLDVARNSIVDFALHADSPELRAQGEMDAATVEIFEAGADISTWVHPENDVSAGASSKKPGSSTQGKHTGSSNNRAWRQFTQFWQALRS